MENQLKGSWQFVAMRELNGVEWVESNDFVEGMTWEFVLEYIGETKHIGTIIESVGRRVICRRPYIYDVKGCRVDVEMYDTKDDIFPTVAAYDVEFVKSETQHTLVMNSVVDALSSNSHIQNILHSL